MNAPFFPNPSEHLQSVFSSLFSYLLPLGVLCDLCGKFLSLLESVLNNRIRRIVNKFQELET